MVCREARVVSRGERCVGWLFPFLFAGGLSLMVVGRGAGAEAVRAPDAFERHCTACHNQERRRGGLALEALLEAPLSREARRAWPRVREMLESGEMPPPPPPESPEAPGKRARPTEEEYAAMLGWIDSVLARSGGQGPIDPGRVTLRRLNRDEYRRTVLDLTGIDYEPAADFPADDVGYGFDNIGDVLSVSPVLMERYLDAAQEIMERAITTENPHERRRVRYEAERWSLDEGAEEFELGVMLYTNAAVRVAHEFPATGSYVIRVRASADQAGDEPARMAVGVGDVVAGEMEVTGARGDWRHYEVSVDAAAGEGSVTVAFVNDYYVEEAPEGVARDRNLVVGWVEVDGPVGLDVSAGWPEAHRRIVIDRPDERTGELEAAGRVIERFAERAFRRPVERERVEPLMGLYRLARENGEGYEGALRVALSAVLVSPEFLFRVERDRAAEDPADPRAGWRLDDYEIASRLSYFLWSTMPDRELLRRARSGALAKDETVRAQAIRMLGDEKARALGENFAGQWLLTRNLAAAQPDRRRFREFDEGLRAAMGEETRRLFEHVAREDRSVLELLSADYTFVNAKLAEHYGIGMPQERDERGWARVSLEGTGRRGVLGHASVLTVTSNPTRTSPVKRGLWVLDQLLNDPPPPPPPDVPELEEESRETDSPRSLRERMELHREQATCRSCHEVMDPIGFAFERFDAIGRYREMEFDLPIDASGELPDGTRFVGLEGLVGFLMEDPDRFVRTLAEKMLTYALGRGLEYYDAAAVDRICEEVRAGEYRFSSLVLAIVTSDPFLRRRAKEPDDE